MTIFNIFTLLGGLAFFLFGMNVREHIRRKFGKNAQKDDIKSN